MCSLGHGLAGIRASKGHVRVASEQHRDQRLPSKQLQAHKIDNRTPWAVQASPYGTTNMKHNASHVSHATEAVWATYGCASALCGHGMKFTH